MASTARPRLIVFSDDWGRHPSSCQHLVRHLLPRFDVYWVNTIGTRIPALDLYTVRRALQKIGSWVRRGLVRNGSRPMSPAVLEPFMVPSFRSRLARGINRRLLRRALRRALPASGPSIAVTTVPLVADLVGDISVSRWVYYCVDDLSEWPGLDRASLQRLERRLLEEVDAVIAVSEQLQQRLRTLGRESLLLTHGVDLAHWQNPRAAAIPEIENLPIPRVVFWGVVDRRLDSGWIEELAARLGRGSVVLVGPSNNPDPRLGSHSNVHRTGPLPYQALPHVARLASVLVMPYADLPATRAMQPLKLKEYLATGRPVVASRLPAVSDWKDACDVVDCAAAFVAAVLRRLETGLPESQARVRLRLAAESWPEKAKVFEAILMGQNPD